MWREVKNREANEQNGRADLMLVLRSKPHEHILGRSVGKDYSRVALRSARPNANKSR
jgi:hypothetical protein